ncbi:GNAT family N-acetyltransferase [Kluyvera sp. STS39-E]|uniref:GNAT family N-acetyltransferase n=1 Tax=Kluyvera sp. STS39-E TaxID=3234748 RepID=UPI0034C5CC90
MYTIAMTSPSAAAIGPLIAALDRYQTELYPQESNHLVDLTQLPEERLVVMLIRHGQEAIGCGAVVLGDDGRAEMKRVYIDTTHRGQRLGEKLLAELETAASLRGCHTLQLETGIHQHAAIRLYERSGYAICEAFSPYQPDPLSVFMTKPLAHQAAQ